MTAPSWNDKAPERIQYPVQLHPGGMPTYVEYVRADLVAARSEVVEPPELPKLPPYSQSAFPYGFHELWTETKMKQYAMETATYWRDDVVEKAAQIVERYGADQWIARDIRHLASPARSAIAPAPAEVVERATANGMAIAAGIVMRCWGNETYAREILGAAGLTTLENLIAAGVDQYDINALSPALSPSLVHAEDGMAHGSATSTIGNPSPEAHLGGWQPLATAPKTGAPFDALTDNDAIVPGVWFDGGDFIVSPSYGSCGNLKYWRPANA